MTIEVIRSSYGGAGSVGDFGWMIDRPEYARTLFVFNDNETQFYEHQRRQGSSHRCSPGGGNAVIRPYQCRTPPRATGVPTGRAGGYASLAEGQRAIDDAIDRLDDLLATGDYDAVAFSWDARSHTLGVSIFAPHRDVLNYIVAQIERTAAGH